MLPRHQARGVAPIASNDARRESPRAGRNYFSQAAGPRSSAAMPLLGGAPASGWLARLSGRGLSTRKYRAACDKCCPGKAQDPFRTTRHRERGNVHGRRRRDRWSRATCILLAAHSGHSRKMSEASTRQLQPQHRDHRRFRSHTHHRKGRQVQLVSRILGRERARSASGPDFFHWAWLQDAPGPRPLEKLEKVEHGEPGALDQDRGARPTG